MSLNLYCKVKKQEVELRQTPTYITMCCLQDYKNTRNTWNYFAAEQYLRWRFWADLNPKKVPVAKLLEEFSDALIDYEEDRAREELLISRNARFYLL